MSTQPAAHDVALHADIRDALHQFDLGRNAMLSDEDLERLVSDTRIVRHMPKIQSVRANAIKDAHRTVLAAASMPLSLQA